PGVRPQGGQEGEDRHQNRRHHHAASAQPVGPPTGEPPLLPLRCLMPGKKHHPECCKASPQRRDDREERRQHQANERELHHHADCSDQQAAMHPQSKDYREASIDKNKNACRRKFPVVQGEVAVHSGTSSRTWPPPTTRSRCPTRLACSASCVTHSTARPARISVRISDSTAATEAASRAAVGS